MSAAVTASPLFAKYSAEVDRESAYELLVKKAEAGAEAAEREQADQPAKDQRMSYPKKPSSRSSGAGKKDGSLIADVVNSRAGREVLRTAAREIVRGVFGVGRRR